MMSRSETADSGPPQQIELTRRQMLQTTAAASGAAALGTGAVETPLTATQDAEAVPWVVIGVALAAGGVAGLSGFGLARLTADDIDIDEDDLSDDRDTRAWEMAYAVTEGKEELDAIIHNNADNTFSDALWSEIRDAATTGVTNGWSKQEAITEANRRIDQYATVSVLNILNWWNVMIEVLGPYFAGDFEDSNEDSYYDSSSDPLRTLSMDNPDPNQYDAWEVDGTQVGHKTADSFDFDLPMDRSSINTEELNGELPPEPQLYIPVDIAPHTEDDSNYPSDWGFPAHHAGDYGGNYEGIEARHSDFETREIKKQNKGCELHKQMKTVYSEWSNTKSQLSDYIETFYGAVSQGAVDKLGALSPMDFNRQFADADQNKRVVAELIAAGLAPPEDLGVRAQINHPDLDADDVWGRVFVQWQDGQEMDLAPGKTINSGDYEFAVFVYPGAVSGELERIALSNSGPLEIVDLSGSDLDKEASKDTTVEDDGDVLLWDEKKDGEVPSWIKNPPAGHEWILVDEDGNRLSFSGPDIEETDDGVWKLPDTSFAPGTNIKSIRAVEPITTTQPIKRVKDTSTVNEERIVERYRESRRLREQVREEINESDDVIPGPGLFGDGLPTLPGLGVVESAVVVVGGSIVSLLGLSAAAG